MRRVLITTGNGMFGRALIEQLLGRDDIQVRAMVRDRSKFTLTIPKSITILALLEIAWKTPEGLLNKPHPITILPERLRAVAQAVTLCASV